MTPQPEAQGNVRKIEIGDKLYLFTSTDGAGNHPQRLIITSHGGYEERAVANRESKGWLTVPRWTRLYFYADHGYALLDPGTKNLLGYRPVQESAPNDAVQNYVLSKFQARGNAVGAETYDGIVNGIVGSRDLQKQQKEALTRFGLDLDAETDPAETERKLAEIEAAATGPQKYELTLIKGKRQVEIYDVLTVRRRRLRSDITLRDVLRELEAAGHRYPEIHCAFCRSPMLPASRESEIRSVDARNETRWARPSDFVRKP